jgi:hypothetical protein
MIVYSDAFVQTSVLTYFSVDECDLDRVLRHSRQAAEARLVRSDLHEATGPLATDSQEVHCRLAKIYCTGTQLSNCERNSGDASK